ncbi:MAG TPA: hypothetical protein VFQ92_07880 [Blastocatellia bacterium]|nr:hypothetical protein [Blastocatellia bacterium]
MKQRALIIFLLMIVTVVVTAGAGAVRQKSSDTVETTAQEQWEYLVVGGSTANLSPSGNPNLRKEPGGPFSREAFVLEQNMDKLGAKGWELVAVTGPSQDPIFYFKRKK